MTASRAAGAVFLALFFTAAAAHAQERSPAAQVPEAGGWIEEGIRMRAERRDEEALALFRRALDATGSPEARAQVALAEQALGRWADAERGLLASMEAHADPWVARNRGNLDAALAEVRTHLGSVTVRSRTPGARVLINNRDEGPLPRPGPLRVVVGTVTIEVRAPGHVPARRVLDVRADDDLLEELDLVPEAPATPPEGAAAVRLAPPGAREPSPGAPVRSWGVGLFVGAGVLTLGASGAWLWRELSARDFNGQGCMVDRASGAAFNGPDCGSLQSQVGAATTLAVAGFAAAGALAAVGLALWLGAPAQPRRAAVACAPGPWSLGCAVAF
ncbi:MAG: PEGA domain-containing protein [Deltaproteobacteria bacterium]|nr:PEGA domain-containing protein [Deltaproteobacteria bacterium]